MTVEGFRRPGEKEQALVQRDHFPEEAEVLRHLWRWTLLVPKRWHEDERQSRDMISEHCSVLYMFHVVVKVGV